MPFDKFYKEFDKFDRRFWLIVLAAAVLVGGYFVLPLANVFLFQKKSSPPYNPAQQVDHLALASQLCNNLPRPESFDLLGTYRVADYANDAVYNRYHSDRSLDEILPPFLVWFDKNGWTLSQDETSGDGELPAFRRLKFGREGQTIWIKYTDFSRQFKGKEFAPPDNYTITCRDETGLKNR